MATREDPASFTRQLLALYNLYRSSLMNEKYFRGQLHYYRQLNRWIEIFLAIGSSTAISGWTYWKTGRGPAIWATVGAVTTVIAILKPILHLSKDIERYSKLQVGYCGLYFDLKGIVQEIATNQSYTKELLKQEKRAYDHYKGLELQTDTKPNKKLLVQCMNEVNQEIPPKSLWMPRGQSNPK